MPVPTQDEIALLFAMHTSPAAADQRAKRAAGFDTARTWVDPNGYTLSDRVWRTRQDIRLAIDDVVRTAILTGADALQTAKLLEAYLLPELRPLRDSAGKLIKNQPAAIVTAFPEQRVLGHKTTGKGSYPARRLMRTEITRAHGQATIAASKLNIFGQGVKWNLSPSHPEADRCDDLAHADKYDLGPGVYLSRYVPRYPSHPMDLCNLSVATITDAASRRAIIDQMREDMGLLAPQLTPEFLAQATTDIVGFDVSTVGTVKGDFTKTKNAITALYDALVDTAKREGWISHLDDAVAAKSKEMQKAYNANLKARKAAATPKVGDLKAFKPLEFFDTAGMTHADAVALISSVESNALVEIAGVSTDPKIVTKLAADLKAEIAKYQKFVDAMPARLTEINWFGLVPDQVEALLTSTYDDIQKAIVTTYRDAQRTKALEDARQVWLKVRKDAIDYKHLWKQADISKILNIDYSAAKTSAEMDVLFTDTVNSVKAASKQLWNGTQYEAQIKQTFKAAHSQALSQLNAAKHAALQAQSAAQNAALLQTRAAQLANMAPDDASALKAILNDLSGSTWDNTYGSGTYLRSKDAVLEAAHPRRGFWDKISSQQKGSVQNYTGGSYRAWNKLLRDGMTDAAYQSSYSQSATVARKHIKNIDAVLKKGSMPADTTLMRGTGSQTVYRQMQGLDVGDVFEDKGFGSHTIDRGTAAGFSKDYASVPSVVFEVFTPAGTPGAYVATVSNYRHEYEWLFPTGTKFRILEKVEEVSSSGGTRTVIRCIAIGP